MYQIKIEHFEGPLDLLLQLIEQQRLDITQLALAHVTEQYIGIMHEAKDAIGLDELADFLVIAAKLLVIKSKALLPYLIWDQDDDEDDLERQLKIYKEFYEASKVVGKIISKKHFAFSREKLLSAGDIGFQPPKSLTCAKLAKIYTQFINGLVPWMMLPKGVIKKTINIQQKIQQIRDLIWQKTSARFSDLLKEAKDKTEVVVSFLALLELVKQRTVVVSQETIFEEIQITKIE